MVTGGEAAEHWRQALEVRGAAAGAAGMFDLAVISF